MDNAEVFALISAERLRLADMLGSLDESQWETMSLCGGWTVRDLGGHLISPFCVSLPQAMLGIITSGSFDRFNDKTARRLGRRPVEEIVSLLRANADHRFTPPGVGPLGPLTDSCVHGRDAARPLGLETSAPLPTWRAVLDFLVSKKARRGFVPAGRMAGLAFAATDQDWTAGRGAVVSGPSEALAMALAGRAAALGDLDGDGLSVLGERL